MGLVIALLGRSNGLEGFVRITQVLVGGGLLTAAACLGIRTAPAAAG